MAVRHDARRRCPTSRCASRGARRGHVLEGWHRLQRAVHRVPAHVHRHRVVRARLGAMARLPAVLPDHAVPADDPRASWRARPATAAGSVDGLAPSDVAGMFSGLSRLRHGVLRNVTLHSVLERRVSTAAEQVKCDLKASGFSTEMTKATVKNLAKLIHRLEVARRRHDALWSDYRDTCSYSDADAKAKQAFVQPALAAGRPRSSRSGRQRRRILPTSGRTRGLRRRRRRRRGGDRPALPAAAAAGDERTSFPWS